jgi:hypothetical protein
MSESSEYIELKTRLKTHFKTIQKKIPTDVYDKLFADIDNIPALLILVDSILEKINSQEYLNVMDTIKKMYNLQNGITNMEETQNDLDQNTTTTLYPPVCNCEIGSNKWCIFNITALYNCRNRDSFLELVPNIGLCFEIIIPNYHVNNYEFTIVPNLENKISNTVIENIIMVLLKLIKNCSNEDEYYEYRFYNRIMIHFIMFDLLFKYFTYVNNNTSIFKISVYNKLSNIYDEMIIYEEDYFRVTQRINVPNNVLDIMRQNMVQYI